MCSDSGQSLVYVEESHAHKIDHNCRSPSNRNEPSTGWCFQTVVPPFFKVTVLGPQTKISSSVTLKNQEKHLPTPQPSALGHDFGHDGSPSSPALLVHELRAPHGEALLRLQALLVPRLLPLPLLRHVDGPQCRRREPPSRSPSDVVGSQSPHTRESFAQLARGVLVQVPRVENVELAFWASHCHVRMRTWSPSHDRSFRSQSWMTIKNSTRSTHQHVSVVYRRTYIVIVQWASEQLFVSVALDFKITESTAKHFRCHPKTK